MRSKGPFFSGFTPGEIRGITVLLILILISTAITFFIKFDCEVNKIPLKDTEIKEDLDKLISKKQKTYQKERTKNDLRSGTHDRIRRSEPFPFDPNVLDSVGWVKLGFSKRQAASILKYKQSGGKFRIKKDLSKLYVVDDETYKRLEPYILLPDSAPPLDKKYPPRYTSNKTDEIIELNNADSAMLTRVRGIGSVFARRIVNYRNRLGGFYKIEQLLEVFGVDSAKFSNLAARLFIDTLQIRKIAINQADFKTLLKHPYLPYYIVKAIVKYRDRYHGFSQIEELEQLDGMYPELYQKLKPYISVE